MVHHDEGGTTSPAQQQEPELERRGAPPPAPQQIRGGVPPLETLRDMMEVDAENDKCREVEAQAGPIGSQ